MPAGVSWSTYLKFMTAAMVSMVAGSQTVHHIYKPLDDLEQMIKDEQEKLQQEKEKS